jgi:hypothetical protein
MPTQQFIADQMAQGAVRACDQTQGSGCICRPHCATSSCSSCPPSATLLHTVNWYIYPVHSEPLYQLQRSPYQGN